MARAIAVASGTADVQGFTAAHCLVGVNVRENAGSPAAASVVLRDGTTTSDPIIAVVSLPASGSVYLPLPAVNLTTGVFVDRGTGTTEVVLYVL